MTLSRRSVLLGGGAALAAAAVGVGVVEELGPHRVYQKLFGSCGSPAPRPLRTKPVVQSGTLMSSHVRRGLGWTLIWPESTTVGAPTAVCLVLPGRAGTAQDVVDLGIADWVTDMTRTRGPRPFALASLDGGSDYWHRRASGDDRLAALLDDFLPLVEDHGLGADGTGRALYGWSMGGYGSLLAAETAPHLFRAVGVSSPAIGTSKANSPDAAFDSRADFAAHDVFAATDKLRGLYLRVDCGDDDPFYPFANKFAHQIERSQPAMAPAPQSAFPAGCHDNSYWDRMRPSQFDMISHALTT